MGKYTFGWNPKKRLQNLRKHNLDFEDVELLFDGNLMVIEDDRNDYGEIRYVGFGELEDIVVVVVFTMREPNTIWIISFRTAEPDEKGYYYGK